MKKFSEEVQGRSLCFPQDHGKVNVLNIALAFINVIDMTVRKIDILCMYFSFTWSSSKRL